MEESRPATDWDRYWRGTWEAAAHEDGSPQDLALERFWSEFFSRSATAGGGRRLLDVAAGNGAVIRYARNLASEGLEPWALDYSVSALFNLRERYPGVHCLAGDALRLPLAPASFDAVVSQFGIEYAGVEAIAAAGELVGAGGYLALVLHYRDGAIYRECANNREALQAVRSLDILELARAAFKAGFALNAGRGSAGDFKAAERAFTPAVRGLEQLIRRYGDQVAGGLPRQLYRDIAQMYQRMSAYAEEDVIAWIDGMGPELEAYIGRMQSMTDAAVDRDSLDRQCRQLLALGYAEPQCDSLRIGTDQLPAAWTLVARRNSAD